MYWKQNPVIFADKDVELIRTFLSHHTIINLDKIQVDEVKGVKISSETIFSSRYSVVGIIYKHQLLIPSIGYVLNASDPSERIFFAAHNKDIPESKKSFINNFWRSRASMEQG